VWVSAAYNDGSDEDEVLAPMTPPTATKTASMDARCAVFAGSSGVVPPPVATTPMPRPQHNEAMCSAAC
jgi:hypothetical protein